MKYVKFDWDEIYPAYSVVEVAADDGIANILALDDAAAKTLLDAFDKYRDTMQAFEEMIDLYLDLLKPRQKKRWES